MEEIGSVHSQEHTPSWLDLYDYRVRVAEMYRERDLALEAGEDASAVLARFHAKRDALFAYHPQSALTVEQRRSFEGLRYFPYDAQMRVEARLTPESAPDEGLSAADGEHTITLRRAGRLDFEIRGTPLRLTVYWIDLYGGGLFLPFRDLTSSEESYGGGRYLFDTVKGSRFVRVDTGGDFWDPDQVRAGYPGGRVVLDFNYAYNPSCAYNSLWVCPLAPKENWLPVPIRAGERKFV